MDRYPRRPRSRRSQDRIAGEAATFVRMARFHAHARIPYPDLGEIVDQLSPDPMRVRAPNGTVPWDDSFHLSPDVVAYLDGLAAEGRVMRTTRGTNLVISDGRLR